MLKRKLWTAGALLAASSAVHLPAQSAPEASKEEAIITLEKFSVQDRITDPKLAIGTDRTRNTITITREALLAAPAGISGLKMLESLPGFNVQTSDALGLYEFGNSVTVRAFSYQQIGFVLDGIPMGRSDQFGGSPIYRYVDNENLGSVTASQGAGDVSLPSYASLGPIASYTTLVPSKNPGVTLQATAGSNSLERTVIKVQTGEWKGLSAYVSRSKQESDQWRGPGTFDREHWDGKIRFAISPTASLQFTVSYNDYFDYDSPAINKNQYAGLNAAGTAPDRFGRSGRYFGYLGFVPDLPPTVPGVTYSSPDYNQYYQQAINARTDVLYGLNAAIELTPELKLTATGYFDDKEGYGVSPEAYGTSLASYNAQRLIIPTLVAPRGLQYGLSTIEGERKGGVFGLQYKLGPQTLSAGGWLENDEYHRTQNRYNQVGGNPAGEPLLSENVHRQRDFVSTRDTVQLYLKDVIALAQDRLKLELGVKALDIDYEISGYRNPGDYIAQRQPKINASWKDEFLPQIGAVYSLTATDQLFTSYAENLALPRGADDIFAAASPAVPAPKAETSQNFEVGYRTNRQEFNVATALYYTHFDDRLQSYASVVPGSTQTETFFQSVGGVESYGVEVSGGYKPSFLGNQLALNGSVTYNHVEFEDSFPGFAIAGKRVPDSPEWMVQTTATYQPAAWAAVSLSGKYLADRYTNFVNTEIVGGYTTYSLYVDLGGNKLTMGPLKNIKLRLNVDNVTDKDAFGTLSTVTTGLATLRPISDRTYQFTVTASF